MQYNKFILVIILLVTACQTSKRTDNHIYGTWKSLWEDDMTLILQLDPDNKFKVTLDRTGQTHTNLGWYTTEGNVFLLKDSIHYPLPVCNLQDTGRYHFELKNDTLQFRSINDPCERRAGALQLERFVRVN